MTRESEDGRRLRWILLGAILTALTAPLAYMLMAQLGGAPAAVPSVPESPAYLADIFGGNTVEQGFHASHDGLCRVDLRLRPVSGECHVIFRLWEEGREEQALGNSFRCLKEESAWYTIRFPRIASSRDVDLLWEIEPVERTSDAVASLEATTADTYSDSALHINGQATGSDAVFVPYYCNAQVAGPLFARWLRWTRGTVIEWLDRDHDLFTVDRLLALVVPMALILVVFLALPPRAQPVRMRIIPQALASRARQAGVRPLTIAALLAACVVGSMLILGAQVRLWARPAAWLRPVEAASIEPTGGPWVAYDLLANLSAAETVIDTPRDWYVQPGWMALGPDRRPVLHMHPPSRVRYTLEVPPRAQLRAAVALDPEVWQPDRGDGVEFIVRTIVDGVEETVYYREIDPKNLPEDRRWHDFEVDLDRYAGQTISLLFITYPLETNKWDRAAWGMPVLLTPSRPADITRQRDARNGER